MRFRQIIRALAIVSSGFVSLVGHGYAKVEPIKKLKKNGQRSVRKVDEEKRAGDPPVAAGGSPKSEAAKGGPDDYTYKKPAARLDPALMAEAEQSTPDLTNISSSALSVPLGEVNLGNVKEEQGWKRQIVTTTFWVGENAAKNNPVANHASSWDPKWAKNYGGTDTPDSSKRSNFIPVAFVPQQNPFYIALPYNDVTRGKHKPEASVVIPWFHKEFKEPGRSVLKGRWVAIRYKDRVCYAQWEDVGPFRTDHWQYVFGNERPKPNLNRGAGLDVSPAVRDYLGMNSTDVTDWKFVEVEDVPAGPWCTLGENNPFVQAGRSAEAMVKNELEK